MSFPSTHLVHINLTGHLTGGEQFVTGFWVVTPTYLSQTELNSLATSVAALITATTFATTRSVISSDSGYDKVRLYQYEAGAPKAVKVAEASITGVIGTGTSYQSLQSALVISLRTGIPGARNRGRMYIPWTAAGLGTDHQIGSTSLDAVLAEWQTFFNAVNALTNVDSIQVVSRTGSGAFATVIQLVADTRVDVQRRRANKQTITARVNRTITP